MLYKEGEKRIKIDYLGIDEFENFKKTKWFCYHFLMLQF